MDESIELASYYGHFESLLFSGCSHKRSGETEAGSTPSTYSHISASSPIYDPEEFSSIPHEISASNWEEICLHPDSYYNKILETNPTRHNDSVTSISSSPDFLADAFNQEVKEAYLMRYFIEELAQWVSAFDSHCDVKNLSIDRYASLIPVI